MLKFSVGKKNQHLALKETLSSGNEITVKWSDWNDKLSSDKDALVVSFSEKIVVVVDVYMPLSILDNIV